MIQKLSEKTDKRKSDNSIFHEKISISRIPI